MPVSNNTFKCIIKDEIGRSRAVKCSFMTTNVFFQFLLATLSEQPDLISAVMIRSRWKTMAACNPFAGELHLPVEQRGKNRKLSTLQPEAKQTIGLWWKVQVGDFECQNFVFMADDSSPQKVCARSDTKNANNEISWIRRVINEILQKTVRLWKS